MPEPTHLNKFEVEYEGEPVSLKEFLYKRGLQLMWTSHSLDPLGEDLGISSGPYEWDTQEREQLRAEIDAVIAKLYGLDRSDFEFVLDSFDIFEKQQVSHYGYYKQKKNCLNTYDDIELRE